MLKTTDNIVMHSYPGMVALITVNHLGEDNIMAAGWHTYISYDPPIYGVAIGRERHSYGLIKAEGKFAINFLPFNKAEFIQEAGVYTGKNTNKFEKGNISYSRGTKTNAPILYDAYIAYECNIIDVNSYGDHDWFVAEIYQFYRDEEMFLGNGLPNFEKISIPLYLGRSTYTSVSSESRFDSFSIKDPK